MEIWHLNTISQRRQGDDEWCNEKYHAADTKYAVSLSLRTSNDFICALVKVTSVQSCVAISWNKESSTDRFAPTSHVILYKFYRKFRRNGSNL